ncbi:Tyrosine-protein phosphatase SIW14 [Cytospora mali]|uniref:diphosphoinositol-polyphosphate diphosphatase n=1 Tax=Cytospora mali TaxID=578113 RepID=A0A194WCK2_CYTMA|nr:Tyrosine-protein phosphatase SIW14 [Valsa mali]
MDAIKTNNTVDGHKGLQQRRSFSNMIDHDGIEDADVVGAVAAQSIEMQRSNSGQTSIESWTSTSSTTTENSLSNELDELDEEKTIPDQPTNFGIVVPGVYRSSFPQESDYAFIQKLKLKTIITLVDKEFPETFHPFMQANGIQHRHITMQGTKKEAIPVSTMASILQVVHDKRNHPVLIHCNQGRHRTGCVVALVRKMQNWHMDRILDEYKAFAAPKPRDCDVEYVTNFKVSEIQHLALAPLSDTLPVQHP